MVLNAVTFILAITSVCMKPIRSASGPQSTSLRQSLLPRKAGLAEVSVGADLVVVHVQQAKGLDDALGSQVIRTTNVLLNELQRLVLRTEALDTLCLLNTL